MGEPVKIYDLAKKMIHLSGLEIKDEDNPAGDIEIKFTGLRPGEKLYEELLIGDNVSETENPMIMRAKEKMLYWIDLKEIVEEMRTSINSGDYEKIKELLVKAVPEFNHNIKSAD
jgi:FlaA1/EpsC-like NDP-sugar epimerase